MSVRARARVYQCVCVRACLCVSVCACVRASVTVFVFIEKHISEFEKEEPLSASIITYIK